MSAQRGKKTRSAASRYRRYVRLTSTTGELRLQFQTCQSKKEKERHAQRVIRAVGRSASTSHRLAFTTFATVGLQASCSVCACDGFDLRSFLSTVTPYAVICTGTLTFRATSACMNYQRPL